MIRSNATRVLLVSALFLGPTHASAQTTSVASTPGVDTLNGDARWREDLHALADGLRKHHANLFFHASRASFDSAVASLDQRILQLSAIDVQIEMLRIVSMVQDNHTRLALRGEAFSWFPIRVRSFKDGWFVTQATSGAKRALGTRLVAIDDTPIDRVAVALKPLSSCENDPCFRDQLPYLLQIADYLRAQNVIPSSTAARFAFIDSSGARFEIDVSSVTAAESNRTMTERLRIAPASREEQLWLLNQDRNYWFEFVPASRTLYVGYNRCFEMPSESMSAFIKRVLSLADSTTIDRTVIDMRRNGGGNSALLMPLIDGIRKRPTLNQRGKLFAIVGRGTYSSAFDNTIMLMDKTKVTVVGEPTGQKPNAYGEVRSFTLPRSGLQVNYSTRFWHRMKGNPSELVPEVLAESSFGDFLRGRDAAMDTILKSRTP